jgi:histidinol-phosphate aminotransferase
MNIKKLVRPELIAMKSYTPIEPVEILVQQVEGKVIKLDGNENPYGCSPKVSQAVAGYPYYHIYPDPEQRKLREALQEYTGVDRQHIVCGSGSDELIDLVLRLFLEPGDRIIDCPPTFGMYPFSAEVCGGRVIDVPRKDEDFALDIAGVKRALDKRTKVIFIASPNNPTGNIIEEQELMELVDTGRVVVIDEAYFEFSGVTMAGLVPAYRNLIVLRTFSKWAGLAGFRIGYGIFPVEIADYLMKIKQPYNVNAAAQVAVLASLSDLDYLHGNVNKIITERERLFGKLGVIASGAKQSHWLKPYPSRANFILCSLYRDSEPTPSVISRREIPRLSLRGTESRSNLLTGSEQAPQSPAKEIWRQLQQRGIFIRYFDTPRLKDCLRISVGRPEDTDALIEALKEMC